MVGEETLDAADNKGRDAADDGGAGAAQVGLVNDANPRRAGKRKHCLQLRLHLRLDIVDVSLDELLAATRGIEHGPSDAHGRISRGAELELGPRSVRKAAVLLVLMDLGGSAKTVRVVANLDRSKSVSLTLQRYWWATSATIRPFCFTAMPRHGLWGGVSS